MITLLGRMSSFENSSKIELYFWREPVRLAAGELLYSINARNGTQSEPRLHKNSTYFKTLHSIGAVENWKISSFFKTRN